MFFLVNNRRSLCKVQKQSRVVWAKLDNPALLLNPEVGFAAAWALCLLCFHFQVHNINKTEILIRLYAHICRPKINNSNKVIPVIQIELCIDIRHTDYDYYSGIRKPNKAKKNFWRVINSITLLIKFGKW